MIREGGGGARGLVGPTSAGAEQGGAGAAGGAGETGGGKITDSVAAA